MNKPGLLNRLRQWAKSCKFEIRALLLAMRHPDTPWYAKAWLSCVAAYAFSPIDLIPDFIPVIGYLDDLVLLPIGIYIGLRMVPPEVMEECRSVAQRAEDTDKKTSIPGALAVIFLWILALACAACFIVHAYY
ncbi:MAG: DUF1232 domain-containing protein [Planctomycetes bacterium]|nr:DUF1232 domain-containing protein [Planctomycetota bacterium]